MNGSLPFLTNTFYILMFYKPLVIYCKDTCVCVYMCAYHTKPNFMLLLLNANSITNGDEERPYILILLLQSVFSFSLWICIKASSLSILFDTKKCNLFMEIGKY